MKVEWLYTVNMATNIVSCEVLRETPKRYYMKPHWLLRGRAFIAKDDTQWFPERIMAIQWMREILKKRILYTDEQIYRMKRQKRVQTSQLETFDSECCVVGADSAGEESYWMQKQNCVFYSVARRMNDGC